jgi:hypothetical protein
MPGFPYNCLPVSCGDIALEARQPAITICIGLSRQTQQFKFKKKVRQTAITNCRGLSHPTGSAALPSEKPSEDINSGLFLMNKKRLKEVPDLVHK